MGVVEPPTPPTEVLGVTMFMFYVLLHVVGALIMARYQILLIQSRIDEEQFNYDKASKKERKEEDWYLEWDSDDRSEVIRKSWFWELFLAYYIIRFLMFPSGIKSKFAREQEKVRKAKEAEHRAAKAEKDLRRMQDEVLRFAPQETAAHALERLRRMADGRNQEAA
jgi:flagellar biosynthesis/type III secretory pathway M-ring protein FliF/YscJ